MREDGGYLLSEVPLKWSQRSTEFLASFLRIAATKTENDDPTKISFWGLFSLLNLLAGTCPSVRSCSKSHLLSGRRCQGRDGRLSYLSGYYLAQVLVAIDHFWPLPGVEYVRICFQRSPEVVAEVIEENPWYIGLI